MIRHRLAPLRTRQKIALFFALVVTCACVAFTFVVVRVGDLQWEAKKRDYAMSMIHAMDGLADAENMSDVRVTNPSGRVLAERGIFARPEFRDVAQGAIVTSGDKSYYVVTEKIRDGNLLSYPQDVTDFAVARSQLLWNVAGASVVSVVLAYLLGLAFAASVLRPVRETNALAATFSLSAPSELRIPVSGPPDDEIAVLASTLNGLFSQIRSDAQRIEQFSGDVSHEFKNHLFELRSSLQLARKRGDLAEAVGRFEHQIDALDRMVDALLLLSRIERQPVELVRTDLADLVSSVSLVRRPNVVLDLEPSFAECNRDLFRLAVENLLGNALKFTPASGTVTLRLRPGELSVVDTGPGIAPENLGRIWDRFFKEDGARTYASGHGLGLAIVKKVVEDVHGFSVSVESELGKGTAFAIRFPKA